MTTPTYPFADQILSRTTLQELDPNTVTPSLDQLLISADADLTVPLRVDASSTPNLVVTINSAVVSNPVSNRQKTIPYVGPSIPSFTSGTVTFPSANGGNITPSVGSSVALNCPSNQYVKVLLSMDPSGNIVISQGTPNAVSASATFPAAPLGDLPICYIVIFNNAGTINNITQSNIFQFGADGGGSSIGPNSITNADLAQMPADTIKGNNTGSTANASDLTGVQVNAILPAFTGDSGSGGVQGLVPAPAAGDAAAGKVLGAGGVWVSGGGGPKSEIFLYGTNGVGSTNTYIERFANIVNSSGSDITYTSSSVNGDSFTINTAGIYAITYSSGYYGADAYHGISLNSAHLTTAIQSLTPPENLGNVETVNNESSMCTVIKNFAVNDVVRPHVGSARNYSTSDARVQFRITRVS